MPPLSPSVLRVNAPPPGDPALRAIAQDVVDQVKYSFAAHAAGEAAGAPGALDGAVAEYMASLAPAVRQRHRQSARAAFAKPPQQRTAELGRYSGLPVTDYRTLGSERLRTRVAAPVVDPKHLTGALKALGNELSLVPPTPKAGGIVFGPGFTDLAAGLKFKKLRLHINSVHCFEESDEIGDDEIGIGGTVTSARGKSKVIGHTNISSEFDTGETKHLGGMPFATWTLVTDNDWPHVYGATLVMVERDHGGFHAFLVKLWEQVEAKVKQAVTAAAGAAIGAALGAAFGGILGAIVGIVLGILIGWLIGIFKDDILGVAVLTMTLASAKKSYYDWAKLTSKDGWPVKLDFKGHGGHYRLLGAYRVAPE